MDAIDEFLEFWKIKSMEYYRNIMMEYAKIAANRAPLTDGEMRSARSMGMFPSNDDPVYYRQKLFLIDMFGPKDSRMSTIIKYAKMDEIERIVDKEKAKKKDKFLADVSNKAGKIIKADLYIEKGEINGLVVGDKATVSVETIGAGGYNVQRYHYRTLVKVVKP